MVKLKRSTIRAIDELFDMTGGYVLNFSDRTFAVFFEDEFGIGIYDGDYEAHGGSKAKHLRCFIEVEDGGTVGHVLRKLWEYRDTIPYYTDVDPDTRKKQHDRFYAVLAEVEADGSRPKTDALERFARNTTLEELVTAIERDIDANKPEAALDRLHTYCMKKFRHLLEARGVVVAKDEPLHSRAGKYLRALRAKNTVRPISLRIMKSGLSIFEAFNDIRNNESFAHDNEIVDHHEARFIFENIVSILRLLKSIEGTVFETA